MRPFLLILCAVITSPCAGYATANVTKRPSLITERFFALRSEQNIYGQHYYDDSNNKAAATLWNKLLLNMGIANPPPANDYADPECRYEHALRILQDIRGQTEEATPYEQLWIENQNKVFSVCDARRSNAWPPLMPTGKNLPNRAASDYLYQKASWYFYQNDFDHAQTFYDQVIAIPDAPMRPYASYMHLRTLRALEREQEAYDDIDTMLADPSLRPAHALIINFAFVMGWEHSGPDPEKHLAWLLSRLQVNPEKAADLKQSYYDYFDALAQIDAYFSLYDTTSKTVDWWLTDTPLESKRMEVVRKMAPQNAVVDWMQAKWTYNVFDIDWLYALHQPQNAYWKQNHHIVQHAWKRWQDGGGLEWLQIAARRVEPKDTLTSDILKAAEPYLARDWQQESEAYQEWLLDMWAQSIRLRLGREEYAQAIALLDSHREFQQLARKQNEVSPAKDYQAVLNNTMRWLLYTGHAQEGRKTLAIMLEQFSNGFRHWRTLLAESREELLAIHKTRHGWRDEDADSSDLWREMINSFSTTTLYAFASDVSRNKEERAFLSRAVVTRAILLGFGANDMDTYAMLAAKLNPSVREPLLNAISRHAYNDYIAFLLRTPRFRPLPYLEYIRPVILSIQEDENKTLNTDMTKIDTFNHNDNDWWCKVDSKRLDDRLFDKARIVPVDQASLWRYRQIPLFVNDAGFQREVEPYLEKQRALLARHPYHEFADAYELNTLEATGSGPEYLTKAVIAQATGMSPSALWNRYEHADAVAANLYQAVRTTRYGCQKDGSHASYSHEAYTLLHKKYGDTIWAKATPYWFGCSHFKNGCAESSENENRF